MSKEQIFILKVCAKSLFTKEYWWILLASVFPFFCFPSLFTDKIWIWSLFGLLGFPLALLTIYGELIIVQNKKDMHEVIKDVVESQQPENNKIGDGSHLT